MDIKKILYLPLDERPCNYKFPYQIFRDHKFEIIRPDLSILGNKKNPANFIKIKQWLLTNIKNAFGLVISIDMLLYGGIVPSRIHHLSLEQLKTRLSLLKTLKENNPSIIIFAFGLIMRCPQYNSSDEEPDYYEEYGLKIFKRGYYFHLQNYRSLSNQEQNYLEEYIPQEYLDDYLTRRKINYTMNIKALDFVTEDIIDYYTIPQDDSSQYGYTAIDQEIIRERIQQLKLSDKVLMYPGADEAGCNLMSRMYCHVFNLKPKVLIMYPTPRGGEVIPTLEDRFIDTMIKYHILIAGGIVATSLSEADCVLLINIGDQKMLSRMRKSNSSKILHVQRNIIEMIEFINYAYLKNKAIIIGDITYGNGSDIEIYNLLTLKNLHLKIAGFGGWNTASNSIGSAIAQGFKYFHRGLTKNHLQFLLSRYIEDIGYCGYIRGQIAKEVLPENKQYNYFNVLEKNGAFSKIVLKYMNDFINNNMSEIKNLCRIKNIIMPWQRMYEIDLYLEVCFD